MWNNLSIMYNTIDENGFVDKSYVKLKTNTIHTTMMLTLIQSLIVSMMWILTRSTWSIIFHFPCTFLEIAWFYSKVVNAWREQEKEYWNKEEEKFESGIGSDIQVVNIEDDLNDLPQEITTSVRELLLNLNDDELEMNELEDSIIN